LEQKTSIWFQEVSLEQVEHFSKNTMVDAMDIQFTEIGPDFITAEMPVTAKVVQPARILHGGASVALAETLGSIGAFLTVNPKEKTAVGMEVNANHISAVKEGGRISATATPLHLGKASQVWEIKLKNIETNKLVCVSRLTVALLNRPAI
jgi:1,4-dihydroxy-2-naphthoyl-CoA hydrolase